MPLAQYSDTFWLPSGLPAALMEARVFLEGSGTLAALWADSAGTIPVPQPVVTSGSGGLTFWAELGSYWLHLDSEAFHINVGVSQEESDQSTGTAFGGRLTVSATPASIDIAPLVGYVVTHTQTSAKPVNVRVTSPQRTVALDAGSLSRILTWWLMDASGAVFQQASEPSNAQRRSNLVLGLTAYDGGSGTVVFVQTLPVVLPQPSNQLADLMQALGPFNISGNRITPVTGTLSFDKTAGTIFAQSFNYFPDMDDPHVSPLDAQTPVTFQYNTQTAFSEGSPTTVLDPGNYDVNGVVTPVPSPTDFTIQRVWGYPLVLSQQVRVQYGQNIFTSMAEAIDAIRNVYFNPNPEAEPFGALLAHIVVRANATDLSDLTQAAVLRAGKFDAP